MELFDLQADPSETVNLAAEREKNSDLIATMRGKLESVIKAEIGDDNGREMLEVAKITWTIDRPDLQAGQSNGRPGVFRTGTLPNRGPKASETGHPEPTTAKSLKGGSC